MTDLLSRFYLRFSFKTEIMLQAAKMYALGRKQLEDHWPILSVVSSSNYFPISIVHYVRSSST